MRWISFPILLVAAGCGDSRLLDTDGGGRDGGPGPDAGGGGDLACAIEEAQEVSRAPDDCGVPSLALDGAGTPHLAWVTAFPNRGRHAYRAPGAWTATDAFLPGVQRVSLAVDAAGSPVAVAADGSGRAALWTGRPLTETHVFPGVNVLPSGRAIAIDDAGGVHLVLRFTDDSTGEFRWGVDYYTGRPDALERTRVAIARNATALDLAVDRERQAAIFYTLDAADFVSRPPAAMERIESPEPASLQLGSAGTATATTVGDTAHVLAQGRGPIPGAGTTLVLTRRGTGGWNATTLATSEVGSCPDLDRAEVGDSCTVDNVHWGRSATLAGRSGDAIVLIVRTHETGTKRFECGLAGERVCDWTGETSLEETVWAGAVGGETVELHEVAPLEIRGTARLNVIAGDDDVLHAALAEQWYSEGEIECRIRYARIRCDRR
jgi:hypothetical protein